MSKTSVKIEMQDETFIGQRLQVAREFRNFTQKQLSEKVVASPAFISLCEAQKKSPSKDLVDACAYVLGFKPAFFYEPVKDCFLEEQCSFRHQRSMGER